MLKSLAGRTAFTLYNRNKFLAKGQKIAHNSKICKYQKKNLYIVNIINNFMGVSDFR